MKKHLFKKNLSYRLFIVSIICVICLAVIISLSSYTNSLYDNINDDLVVIKIPNTNEDFYEDRVIVTLKKEYSKLNGIINIEDFCLDNSCDNFAKIEDLFPVKNPTNNNLINTEDFQQILSIELTHTGKDKVIEAIKSLSKSKIIKSVEPKYKRITKSATLSYDTLSSNQWALNGNYGINVESAWDISGGDLNVKVGIMEKSVQTDHEDLNGRISMYLDSDEDTSHGTEVSGIIGAIRNNDLGITGIAQSSMVIINDNYNLVKSLEYAANNNIWLINASFIYVTSNDEYAEPTTYDQTAIKNYKGLLICAASNEALNADETPAYPAGYCNKSKFSINNIISVGAINSEGNISSFSNYGAKSVSIFAPGERILSTQSKNKYAFVNGTSFAAPQVTGVAALLYSHYINNINSTATPDEIIPLIKNAILASATKQNNLKDYCISGGRLDAAAALKYMDPFYYSINSGEATITGLKFEYDTDLVIPNKIKNYPVTTIGDSAFKGQNKLKGVTISNSIETIGNYAFQDCANLINLSIKTESSLFTIGNYAFAGCARMNGATIPKETLYIGDYAFYNCSKMIGFSFATGSKLTYLGRSAFENCIVIPTVEIPENLTVIPHYAFKNCQLLASVRTNTNPKLTTIQPSAFADCNLLYNIEMPKTVNKIGADAFANCRNLTSIALPSDVQTIGSNAFYGCEMLTVFCAHQSKPSGWASEWNSSNRPVAWGCNITGTYESYVTSFTKSATNPTNSGAVNGISNPHRNTIDFEGWYTTSDFSGTRYANISSAPNGTLYAKWKDSCIAEGSMITLADGSQKAVENLTGDEILLVWNLFTGTYDVAPILFIDRDERGEYEVINLNFSDGTTVKVISEHAFFDVDQGKYVYLRNDAAKYIGHRFSKQSADTSGNKVNTAVTLLSVDITTETTVAYSPVTYGHLCYYVDGMLSMPGATEPFANIFEVDKATMCYDADKMQADIAEYGLFTYEEFSALLPVSEEVFEAFGGKYLKVAIGKGLTDLDEIAALIERYSRFLNF